MIRTTFYFSLLLMITACAGPTKKQKSIDMTENMICDPETGICELPSTDSKTEPSVIELTSSRVKVIYFTDPICSSCWGIEPQLRKLKLVYGNQIDWEYRMGGLLPNWSYNSGGISKPSDVASHWDEVSKHYKMPIDGDLWLEDPLHSSYPPSIAFKAAQMQDEHKAQLFLRLLREMVFMQKKNICKWTFLSDAGSRAGLDTARLKVDIEGAGQKAFQNDLELSKVMGVRGFPTLFVVDQEGNRQVIYGSRPYNDYLTTIAKIDDSLTLNEYNVDWKSLFKIYPTLTTREYAELSNVTFDKALKSLNQLEQNHNISSTRIKNGAIWRLSK